VNIQRCSHENEPWKEGNGGKNSLILEDRPNGVSRGSVVKGLFVQADVCSMCNSGLKGGGSMGDI